MKKLCLCVFMLLSVFVRSQHAETFKGNGFTLIFNNQDPALKTEVKDGLVKTFFAVYPKLVKDFNPEAIKTLEVQIDTAYDGVAYAHNGRITISSEWLRKKPEDLDVMTHEVMHIVQSYPNNSGPGWLTEGIADYVRHVYGIDNKGAGWALPAYTSSSHYTQSYRITARFLLWSTNRYDRDLVVKLDKQLRNNRYDSGLWKEYTGKTLSELYEEYREFPEIS